MSFTLLELTALTQHHIQHRQLNVNIRGKDHCAYERYPLLHWILIALSRETNHKLLPHYIELFEKCLIAGANPNILDCYGNTPLHCIAVDYPDNVALVLAELFIHYKADPNFLSDKKIRPYEHGLIYNPGNELTLRFLSKEIKDPKSVRKNLKKIFADAYETEDIDLINRLMNTGLVEFDPEIKTYKPPLLLELESVSTGFWIRSVSDIDKEAHILCLRDGVKPSKLQKQRHQKTPDLLYTNYSPATFVCPGVPIALFESTCGVMIRPNNRTIPYWYDGLHGEQLTHDMDFSKSSRLSNGHDGQYREISEKEIAKKITQKYSSDVYRISKSQLDNHRVLFKKQVGNIQYPWNEGLFRYKTEDIFGIYVNLKSRESCFNALNLREKLGLSTVPLYHYENGNIKRIHSKDIIKLWVLQQDSAAGNSQAMFAPASAAPASSRIVVSSLKNPQMSRR